MAQTQLYVAEELTAEALYPKLKPSEKNWRCEQHKKACGLMAEGWAKLGPLASGGRWDKESAYTGVALWLKGYHAAQGFPQLSPEVAGAFPALSRTLQEHMPWVTAEGRRLQADDNPARYALRVTFTCVGLVSLVGLGGAMGTQLSGEAAEGHAELINSVTLMGNSALEKLGGPLLHEGSLTPADSKGIAALATTQGGAAAEALLQSIPVHVTAIYMLQVLYDIDLRVLKWVLHYCLARAAKDAYARARVGMGAAGGRDAAARAAAAANSARERWLSHCRALQALEPGSGLAAFMEAEVRSQDPRGRSDTIRDMRAAAETAARRGDDLTSWLAHLNTALLLAGRLGRAGPEGAQPEDVQRELDAAAAQRASARRWGGALLLEGRCRAVKQEVQRALQAAGVEGLHLEGAQGEAGPSAAASAPRDPYHPILPAELPARKCSGCEKLFHKASLCGRCRSVWYCSRACQAAHWRAGHKAECSRLAEERARAGAGGEGSDDEEGKGKGQGEVGAKAEPEAGASAATAAEESTA
ncbi:hypothetical protein HYH03_002371 [Edaphochlamys debaryana]|uniref:MYND-type domain-containing protein n=1 Tax=Edaphochlamys debaryana TaxID=47281 RepID=A0A835YCY5_9CHLO|nr:hypothetical protein HYH03_002371 [Edaphochlamys debaryana]|eukprot:KAG2499424.1 hypothetical protein HYH03_002371 [Edaphochlamys debaryana]